MLMADFEQQVVQAPLLQMFQYKQLEVEDQDLEDLPLSADTSGDRST